MDGGADPIPAIVAEVAEITDLVRRFRLVRQDGGPLPAFEAGAHVTAAFGDGTRSWRNAYSLMGPLSDRSHYLISVRRDDEGNGGSLFLHGAVGAGFELEISPPVQGFALDLSAGRHLLLAGGIGIAPLMAQAEALAARGADFELHYKARTSDRAAYRMELHARHGARMHSYCGDLGQELDIPALLAAQPPGTHLYLCGPEGMIERVGEDAAALAWPPERIHVERFLVETAGEPFAVVLAASGRTVAVGADQSLLQALEAAGIAMPFVCRGGACGRCETGVLACEGEILHRDCWLDAAGRAAGRRIMPCVSRFRGRRLLLDL
ncbi:Ferredoxin-NADP reductase [Tistlia consotensis]|uniref:Ferredoxin-NADP reductase n=1 Tax=Tistlia consotensis USBA 355 TaxID=560819 RepID=A0A1Y6CM03_9PROT|nr:PDR/VanB family oxidoreductase [Tistlia consotensis]SMF73675.1 Ferredoxin-NADP reductase [Tistlia consotensis USBA 355]SNS28444.1 Ferredoxin-NADP reductase [Tistlia consotensis]